MNTELVTAERIPRLDREALRVPLEARLGQLSSGLDVSVRLEGVTSNGFVRIGVQGTDSEVFTELIKRKLRIAPCEFSEIEIDDNLKAYVTKIDLKRQTVEVEIGPVSTRVKTVIAREGLAAQLCDGRDIPVDKIAGTYCIHEDVPIYVRITSIDRDSRRVEAWLSDDQVAQFEQWRRQRLHRIIAVGGFQDRLREAMRLSKVERDIAELEELALTAHTLVCTLGTEAPGIIAKIGRYISDFKLYTFLPERVDRFRSGVAER